MQIFLEKNSLPAGILTQNPQIRNLMLYTIELQGVIRRAVALSIKLRSYSYINYLLMLQTLLHEIKY